MKNRIDRLIEAYFEGTISPRQEQRLKAFLASEEGAAKEYDDIRAVMGFFSVGRSLEAAAGQQDKTEGMAAAQKQVTAEVHTTTQKLAVAGQQDKTERQDATERLAKTERLDKTERQRGMPGRTVTLIPMWAKAAAVACSVALVTVAAGLLGRNDVDRVCITTCQGRTFTDEDIVMEEVENTLAELLSNCESVNEQLNEFFGE